MKFLEKVNQLQKENEGYMVFVKCGIFFNVIGKDAVVLQQRTELLPICIKENVCKCGVPVNTFAKFLKKFTKQNKIALVAFDYNKEDNEYREIIRIEGEKVTETRTCLDCKKCWYSNNRIINNFVKLLFFIFDDYIICL